jgi:hypothetical protein
MQNLLPISVLDEKFEQFERSPPSHQASPPLHPIGHNHSTVSLTRQFKMKHTRRKHSSSSGEFQTPSVHVHYSSPSPPKSRDTSPQEPREISPSGTVVPPVSEQVSEDKSLGQVYDVSSMLEFLHDALFDARARSRVHLKIHAALKRKNDWLNGISSFFGILQAMATSTNAFTASETWLKWFLFVVSIISGFCIATLQRKKYEARMETHGIGSKDYMEFSNTLEMKLMLRSMKISDLENVKARQQELAKKTPLIDFDEATEIKIEREKYYARDDGVDENHEMQEIPGTLDPILNAEDKLNLIQLLQQWKDVHNPHKKDEQIKQWVETHANLSSMQPPPLSKVAPPSSRSSNRQSYAAAPPQSSAAASRQSSAVAPPQSSAATPKRAKTFSPGKPFPPGEIPAHPERTPSSRRFGNEKRRFSNSLANLMNATQPLPPI